MVNPRAERVTVFAPATVANVAAGFDVLGFAFSALGDLVTVERLDDADPARPVVLGRVQAPGFDGDQDVPVAALENTATRALLALVAGRGLGFGFRVELVKGIPLGSGLGGSAASAAGAVVAAAALLGDGDDAAARRALLPHAMAGEAAASGAAHGDNAGACLLGGMCAFLPGEPGARPDLVQLPVPGGLTCVLVRPRLRLDTRAQRAALQAAVPLADMVRQSACLAGVVAACFRDDLELLGRSLQDLVIAPQRGPSIPGFAAARAAARDAGALGCSISGSGPSMFALVGPGAVAEAVRDAMVAAVRAAGVEADSWIDALPAPGASIRSAT